MVFQFMVKQISQQFVESLLAIHGKYSELVQSVFNNDQQFIAALDKVGQSVISAFLRLCLDFSRHQLRAVISCPASGS